MEASARADQARSWITSADPRRRAPRAIVDPIVDPNSDPWVPIKDDRVDDLPSNSVLLDTRGYAVDGLE
jgi:hypothetical protein